MYFKYKAILNEVLWHMENMKERTLITTIVRGRQTIYRLASISIAKIRTENGIDASVCKVRHV